MRCERIHRKKRRESEVVYHCSFHSFLRGYKK